MNEHSDTINTRSRGGQLQEPLADPEKHLRSPRMISSDDWTKPEREEMEKDIVAMEAEQTKLEADRREALLNKDTLKDQLKEMDECMTMEIILQILEHEKAGTSKKKEIITKAWKKNTKKNENTAQKFERSAEDLRAQIEVVEKKNEPTKEVNLIKTRVSREVERIKKAQEDIEKEKDILANVMWDQEESKDTEITAGMLETLRHVNESESQKLIDRLDTIFIDLEDKIKTIRDLTDSPSKFSEDRRNAPPELTWNASEKNWKTFGC